mgnify:CR=1 FL=1
MKGETNDASAGIMGEYTISDIEDAPNAPGIYAWYHKLYLSAADMRVLSAATDDRVLSEEALQLLEQQTEIFSNPPINLYGKGHFNSNWKAVFSEQSTIESDPFQRSLSAEELESFSNNKTKNEATNSFSKDFFKALTANVDVFAPPIYIGKAENLNTRLNNHIKTLRRVKKGLREDLGFRDALEKRLRESSINFGHRAGAIGISEDNLIVKTVNFEKILPRESKEKLYKLAGEIEYFLNRWYKPHLGRL